MILKVVPGILPTFDQQVYHSTDAQKVVNGENRPRNKASMRKNAVVGR